MWTARFWKIVATQDFLVWTMKISATMTILLLVIKGAQHALSRLDMK